MARKATPNVMDELLGTKSSTAEAPAEKPAEKPKPARKRKTAAKPKNGQRDEKTVKEAVSPPSAVSEEENSGNAAPDTTAESDDHVELPKDKLTIYLDPAINDELEMLRLQLRKILRPGRLHNVSKSAVTEAALAIVVREFEKKGDKSQIVAEIARRDAS